MGVNAFSSLKKNLPRETDIKINRYVKIGLLLTAILSITIIMIFPSVIEMWYNLGSLFIPPLLLPLLATYIPFLRISKSATLTVMILSFCVTLFSYLWGSFNIENNMPAYLFGLEPFFPGFMLTIIWYGSLKLYKTLFKKRFH